MSCHTIPWTSDICWMAARVLLDGAVQFVHPVSDFWISANYVFCCPVMFCIFNSIIYTFAFPLLIALPNTVIPNSTVIISSFALM
ncbi:hypothetical protein EV361DRAFT_652068 [Lentinula raphanica]|nr:hypothetical protein EV361DRAFT_652068 [Lentinula raphanica]